MRTSKLKRLRQIIEQAAEFLDDKDAMEGVELFPAWDGAADYEVGQRVRYEGILYRCIQGHTAQPGWKPADAPSLWVQICETHDGTEDDPIPYEGNMALESGKYYIQGDHLYRCIRDTVNPVYSPLAELVGLYVELVW